MEKYRTIWEERRQKMKLAINKNQIDAKLLEVPLSNFTENTEFAVTSVRDNYAYENGVKTEKWLSTTLSCVDTVTFATIDIKVEQHINLTQDEIDQSESTIYVEIPLEKTIVRPYAIEYGKAKLSIIAPSVKIIRQ